MAFPRRLLVEGESLVLDLRPHPIALAGLLAVSVLVLVGVILAFVYAPDHGTGRTVVVWGSLVVGAILLVIYVVPKFVAWATSHFVVTSDRVIHRQGWIAKRSMEIPLEAINDVRFEQGVFDRMIGAGSLVIESAGERGREEFHDIRKPETVQKTIYHQGEQNQQRMFQGRSGATTSAPSATTELQRLADLRDRGVLTEEEFEAQKRKILGQ